MLGVGIKRLRSISNKVTQIRVGKNADVGFGNGFRWKITLPQIEEEIHRKEKIIQICRKLSEQRFFALAAKIAIREKNELLLDEIYERSKNNKTHQARYAKILISQEKGEVQAALSLIRKSESKQIEEVEQIGIQWAKINKNEGAALAQALEKQYPEHLEVLIASYNILRKCDQIKAERIRSKITREITSEHRRKTRNRAAIALFGEGAELDFSLKLIKEGKIRNLEQEQGSLKQERITEATIEVADVLKGEFFEIEDPQVIGELLEQYMKLKKRATEYENGQLSRIRSELSAATTSSQVMDAANRFERVNWRFVDLASKEEVAGEIADEAIRYSGSSIMISLCARMRIIQKSKEGVEIALKLLREVNDFTTSEGVVFAAVEAKIFKAREVKIIAQESEKEHPVFATRIRCKLPQELSQDAVEFVLRKANHMEREMLGKCIRVLIDTPEIRKARNTEKLDQIIQIYNQREPESKTTEMVLFQGKIEEPKN